MSRRSDVSGPSGGQSGIHVSLGNTGNTSNTGHAVVVGGSMAGLLAARVLANHFDQVTLVERDALTDSPTVRKGVPQGRMLHALMPRGLGIVERVFPGYGHELTVAGAVPVHIPSDALILTLAGWLPRQAAGASLLSASRPLFEWAVRRRLRELPGVMILDRHDVTSLLTSSDGRQVTGVTLRSLDASGTEQLAADLVVDASGRGSRTPTWLSDSGYGTPAQMQVDSNIAYASRIYRIRTGSVPTGSWRCCWPNRRRCRALVTCSRSSMASGWWP